MRISSCLLILSTALSFNGIAQEIKPIPKTSKEAFVQCEKDNQHTGSTENCRDDFVYKTMVEAEKRHAAGVSARAAAKAQAARPGVRIGMTQEEVIQTTHWGRPHSINRTTTASGTSEQWVYGSGNYLYFTNGKLTAIQN